MKGKLTIIAATSSTGKSSLIESRNEPNQSLRYVTRNQRNGEISSEKFDGSQSTHGYFVTKQEFKTLQMKGNIIGAHEYMGEWYGFDREKIKEKIETGKEQFEQVVPLTAIYTLEKEIGRNNLHLILAMAPSNKDKVKRLAYRFALQRQEKAIDRITHNIYQEREYILTHEIFDEIKYIDSASSIGKKTKKMIIDLAIQAVKKGASPIISYDTPTQDINRIVHKHRTKATRILALYKLKKKIGDDTITPLVRSYPFIENDKEEYIEKMGLYQMHPSIDIPLRAGEIKEKKQPGANNEQKRKVYNTIEDIVEGKEVRLNFQKRIEKYLINDILKDFEYFEEEKKLIKEKQEEAKKINKKSKSYKRAISKEFVSSYLLEEIRTGQLESPGFKQRENILSLNVQRRLDKIDCTVLEQEKVIRFHDVIRKQTLNEMMTNTRIYDNLNLREFTKNLNKELKYLYTMDAKPNEKSRELIEETGVNTGIKKAFRSLVAAQQESLLNYEFITGWTKNKANHTMRKISLITSPLFLLHNRRKIPDQLSRIIIETYINEIESMQEILKNGEKEEINIYPYFSGNPETFIGNIWKQEKQTSSKEYINKFLEKAEETVEIAKELSLPKTLKTRGFKKDQEKFYEIISEIKDGRGIIYLQ